jgi:hypothetical protein
MNNQAPKLQQQYSNQNPLYAVAATNNLMGGTGV